MARHSVAGAFTYAFLIALVVCLAGFSAAVSAAPTAPVTQAEHDKAQLLERVERYWRARELNDIHTAFELEAAAWPRGWLTPMLAARMGLSIRDVSFELLEYSEDAAVFRLEGRVEVGAMGFVPQTSQDRWIRIDGEWFHDTPEP